MLKGLKQALGVGSAQEFYARAQGELAQQNPTAAIQSFATAARKAEQEGQPDLRARAEASAALYRFIGAGALDDLRQVAERLPTAGWIERPGDASDQVPADALVAEIEGRLAVVGVDGRDAGAALEAHRRAAEAFGRCLDHRLVTYAYHYDADRHVDVGRSRHLYHTGMMHALTADQLIASDPDAAGRAMSRAVAAFAACSDAGRQQSAADTLRRIQTRRTCWLCQREFPVEGRYHGRTQADVTPYVAQLLGEQGQDASSVDTVAGEVVLCSVCRSVVDGRAQLLLERSMSQLEARLAERVNRQIAEMMERMSRR